MAQWVIRMIQAGGYPAVVVLMFIENVFPPIPSEVIVPLAGYLASEDHLSLWGVIAAGTAGCVLGALPLYYAGLKIGEERLKKLADRHGRWMTVSREEIEQAKQWFDRHGGKAVLICRIVPGFRSLISVPAGVARMNMAAFLAYTAAGSALWITLLAWLGYLLSARFQKVGEYLDPISNVILGSMALWYAVRVIRHKKEREA